MEFYPVCMVREAIDWGQNRASRQTSVVALKYPDGLLTTCDKASLREK
jgi:hypothetical protein